LKSYPFIGLSNQSSWLLVVLLVFSSGCAGPNIEASKVDLPEALQALMAQKYGECALPTKDRFGALEPLRERYGNFVPYYADGYLNPDSDLDFAVLLFLKEKVLLVFGLGTWAGNYALLEMHTAFWVKPKGANDVYLLVAKPGRHHGWDGRPIDLQYSGFYVGTLSGPEYLLYWSQGELKQRLSRD
jgi:hypothetical protein